MSDKTNNYFTTTATTAFTSHNITGKNRHIDIAIGLLAKQFFIYSSYYGNYLFYTTSYDYNNMVSTAALFCLNRALSLYIPVHIGRGPLCVKFPRNASCLPRGDLDPGRVAARITYSTTKKTHEQVSA